MMKDHPITVIILDDIGHEFLAVAYTPVIDKLASEGVWFRQAWAYPMCSPARAALMTGRHGFRTGIGSNIKPEQEMTGTMKYRKVDLKKDGYAPESGDTVYLLAGNGQGYQPIDEPTRDRLEAGALSL